MDKKTFEQKDKSVWEWDETVEVTKAIQNYYNLVKQNASKATNR
jgi:hypothetical protein